MKDLKISVTSESFKKLKADLLVIPVFKSKNPVAEDVAELDQILKGRVSKFAQWEDFSGESGAQLSLFVNDLLPYRQIALIGMGEVEKWELNQLRKMSAKTARFAKSTHASVLAISLPKLQSDGFRYGASPEELAQVIVEGVQLGTYEFPQYKSPKKKKKPIQELIIVSSDKKLESTIKSGIFRGQIYAQSTSFARDLVNEPPSFLTPKKLGERAQSILKETGIKVSIQGRAQIKKLGMNAFLAVSRGSSEEPKMIRMEYTPSKRPTQHIMIIGKGVTFDSGGLSLKNAKSMETMKDDMAGSAAVIGAMFGLSKLKPNIKVTGLILATENMPDGRAIKPGDVVKAMNGKTIEILNTDAEGRLTLADGLSYAQTLKPNQVIDIATLTGACLVALGSSISAALGNSSEMIQKIIAAANRAGESVWELPLHEEYRESIKSDVAEIKNTGGPYAGTITAALFLSEFVENFDWTHLDIAGPAWSEKDAGIFTQGGTGAMVRTLLNYLCSP